MNRLGQPSAADAQAAVYADASAAAQPTLGGAGPLTPAGPDLPALGRQSLAYGLGVLGGRLAALAMVPVLARALGPEDFGLMELGNTIGAACSVVLALGMGSAVQREYFEGPAGRRMLVVSTGFWTLTGWMTIAVVVLAASASPMARLLLGDASLARLIRLVVLVTASTILLGFAGDTIRLHFRPLLFGLLNLGQGLAVAAAILTALIWVGPAVSTVYLGTLVGSLLCVPAALWCIRRDLAAVFSTGLCRRMLAFGVPLALSIVPEWTLSLADRLFLSQFASLGEIGQYAIAVKLASAPMLVTAGFQQAWSPYFFGVLNSGADYRPLLARVFRALLAALLVLGAPLAIFAPEAAHLLAGPGYERAAGAVWLLLLGNTAVALNNVLAYGIAIERRTTFFVILPGVAALANLGLNFLLIPSYGMMGAAWATMASYLLLSGLYYHTSRRLIPVPLPVRPAVIAAAAFGMMGFAASTWLGGAGGPLMLVKGVVLAGWWWAAFGWLLSPGDRRDLLALAKAWWPARLGAERP